MDARNSKLNHQLQSYIYGFQHPSKREMLPPPVASHSSSPNDLDGDDAVSTLKVNRERRLSRVEESSLKYSTTLLPTSRRVVHPLLPFSLLRIY